MTSSARTIRRPFDGRMLAAAPDRPRPAEHAAGRARAPRARLPAAAGPPHRCPGSPGHPGPRAGTARTRRPGSAAGRGPPPRRSRPGRAAGTRRHWRCTGHPRYPAGGAGCPRAGPGPAWRADVHAAVQLHGVGVDDLAAELLASRSPRSDLPAAVAPTTATTGSGRPTVSIPQRAAITGFAMPPMSIRRTVPDISPGRPPPPPGRRRRSPADSPGPGGSGLRGGRGPAGSAGPAGRSVPAREQARKRSRAKPGATRGSAG